MPLRAPTFYPGLPTDDCHLIFDIWTIASAIASASAAIIFFMRVRAMHPKSKFIPILLGAILLFLAATLVLVPILVHIGHIGPTKYCIIEPHGAVLFGTPLLSVATNAVYDALVFVFVSWRLRWVAYEPSERKHWWAVILSFFRTDGLPRFSRTLLRHTQLYYL